MADAQSLCSQAGATALSPFRAINHSIPLIDEGKIYPSLVSFALSRIVTTALDRKEKHLLEIRAMGNDCRTEYLSDAVAA